MEITIKPKFIGGNSEVYIGNETTYSYIVKNTNPLSTRCVAYDINNNLVAESKRQWLHIANEHEIYIHGKYSYYLSISNAFGAVIYNQSKEQLYIDNGNMEFTGKGNSVYSKINCYKESWLSMYFIRAEIEEELDVLLFCLYVQMKLSLNSYAPPITPTVLHT